MISFIQSINIDLNQKILNIAKEVKKKLQVENNSTLLRYSKTDCVEDILELFTDEYNQEIIEDLLFKHRKNKIQKISYK